MDATIERNRLRASIEPKSDQINYDDLVAGPRTFTVAGVSAGNGEQPVNVRLKDEPRYFRPCKTMRRLMIYAWGDDGHQWVGRSMTLVGDAAVSFGGVKVGGVRISHMSHIDGPLDLALTVTRGKRAPYRVLPLKPPSAGESQRTEPPADRPEGSSAPPTSDPPVAYRVSLQGMKGLSDWIDAVQGRLTVAEDPAACWDENLDAYNKLVMSKKGEADQNELRALKDHAEACIRAVNEAAILGA